MFRPSYRRKERKHEQKRDSEQTTDREQKRNSDSKHKRKADMIQTAECAPIVATDPADD
jgi:hypothetical protein